MLSAPLKDLPTFMQGADGLKPIGLDAVALELAHRRDVLLTRHGHRLMLPDADRKVQLPPDVTNLTDGEVAGSGGMLQSIGGALATVGSLASMSIDLAVTGITSALAAVSLLPEHATLVNGANSPAKPRTPARTASSLSVLGFRSPLSPSTPAAPSAIEADSVIVLKQELYAAAAAVKEVPALLPADQKLLLLRHPAGIRADDAILSLPQLLLSPHA